MQFPSQHFMYFEPAKNLLLVFLSALVCRLTLSADLGNTEFESF